MPRLSVLLAVLCAPSFLCAQNTHPTPPPEVRAVPPAGSIKLDGKLDGRDADSIFAVAIPLVVGRANVGPADLAAGESHQRVVTVGMVAIERVRWALALWPPERPRDSRRS